MKEALADRIARLVVIPVRLPGDYGKLEELRRRVGTDGVGGILLFGGDLDLTPRFLKTLRESARHPLLVMSDVERGVGQQIEGCLRHPPNMAVGALRDASAAYALGAATALECRRVGIDMALGPVLDLYNEPRNPIIGTRAFGEDPELVISLGIAWIEGWEGATNVMFVAERGDRWIGMAVGSRTDEEADAHLYGMWVDPTFRGAGVGARLVEGVLAWARSWDARSVTLGVTETNDGAVGFYEHLGFADTGERYPLREGSRLTCRTLRREL